MRLQDKIFLASGSPRRRELLGNLFRNIQYLKSSLDEPTWSKNEAPKHYLSRCLSVKWKGAQIALPSLFPADETKGRYWILVADTTVDLGGKLLEKPKDRADAARMLKALSGKTHVVRTGHILGLFEDGQAKSKKEYFVESVVQFHSLSPAETSAYVKTGSPMDKAGAYGFQDQALKFVKKIEGSYLNVVGLSLSELEREAEKLGVR
jgi:septum formation protein